MIDCVYYNDKIRCYRNGRVERFWKKGWNIVENTANAGKGYNHLKINGKMIYRHRLLAYCFLGLENVVGERGRDDVIDHISGIPLDNSVANLRITTQQGNTQNTKAKGYYLDKRRNKYQASIILNRKNIYLGYYDTEEEAHQAYLDAKRIYHII